MKTTTNYRNDEPLLELAPRNAETPRRWLPPQALVARSLDLTHWQSRAAHGHTWNGAALLRRRTH